MKNAKSMPSWTSPRASFSVLPISRVISCASSSFCVSSSSPMRRSSSPRLGIGKANHSGYAAFAASTASSTSDASLHATSPSTSSRSAGLRSSMVRPERAGTHLPPMKFVIASVSLQTLRTEGHVERQREATARAARLLELGHGDDGDVEAPLLELAAHLGRARRHDDGGADHHRVGAELERRVVVEHEQLGHHRLDHL